MWESACGEWEPQGGEVWEAGAWVGVRDRGVPGQRGPGRGSGGFPRAGVGANLLDLRLKLLPQLLPLQPFSLLHGKGLPLVLCLGLVLCSPGRHLTEQLLRLSTHRCRLCPPLLLQGSRGQVRAGRLPSADLHGSRPGLDARFCIALGLYGFGIEAFDLGPGFREALLSRALCSRSLRLRLGSGFGSLFLGFMLGSAEVSLLSPCLNCFPGFVAPEG